MYRKNNILALEKIHLNSTSNSTSQIVPNTKALRALVSYLNSLYYHVVYILS